MLNGKVVLLTGGAWNRAGDRLDMAVGAAIAIGGTNIVKRTGTADGS